MAMSPIAQIAQQMQLTDEAQALVAVQPAPLQAVASLIRARHYRDALPLSLRLLPKPYAVAWVCQCARAQPLDECDARGLRIAQQWMRDHDEPSRQAAQRFAETDGYRSAGAWLAAAAAWADDGPSVEGGGPPAEHLTATAATSALLHLASREPEQFDERLRHWSEQAYALLADVNPPERHA